MNKGSITKFTKILCHKNLELYGIFAVLTSLLILNVSLCSVSDSSSQGFDPSEFPVLSLSSRARHDSSGGLITSSAFSQRPGYGMYLQHVQWTSLCALIRLKLCWAVLDFIHTLSRSSHVIMCKCARLDHDTLYRIYDSMSGIALASTAYLFIHGLAADYAIIHNLSPDSGSTRAGERCLLLTCKLLQLQ